MSTTLRLDSDLVRSLEEKSKREGKSFKETVNEVLRSGLDPGSREEREPFKVIPHDGKFLLGCGFVEFESLE